MFMQYILQFPIFMAERDSQNLIFSDETLSTLNLLINLSEKSVVVLDGAFNILSVRIMPLYSSNIFSN